jgi:hypothetical protein
MKAGGKLLEQEKQEQLRKAEAEQERTSRYTPAGSSGGYADHPEFDTYTGTLRSDDPDLFDIVLGAIRYFTK